MGGMIYSIFDNPHRYKWEPDIQKIQKNLVVVKIKPEDWPDEHDSKYRYVEGTALRIANEIEKIKLSKAKQKSYYNQYTRLLVVRDEVKKKFEQKEEELKKLTQKDITLLKREIATYKNNTVSIGKQIFEIKNFTLTVGHLRELLEDVGENGKHCIIQIQDSYDSGYWRNCRYTMLRVLLDETRARGMVPSDPKAVIDP